MRINTNTWNRIRYGLYAPVYDLIARPLENGRRRSIELLALEKGERVLLIGAGTGLDLEHLPRGVQVMAVDLSPAMLRQAASRAEDLGLAVETRVMDAHRLDLPDASFDVVVLHLILAVIPDPWACIQEAARVLKPHGRVAIFDKFLPDAATPSLGRRVLGVLTNALFSDINRRLGPLLQHGGLRPVHEEASMLGGAYKVVIAKR